ncbi:TetR/AcrR family transcriptional regulator [Sphingobium sp. EM0848]|uniref:TetR/AcrR family transcriptional regulator n=1 Tax=Sphingobium sp. EM0848 TaxID=2743473 RepID=UPI00159C5B0C|nr:TetR/AcrR family transcriptional regulator [Sphingobium sp. EM0848]
MKIDDEDQSKGSKRLNHLLLAARHAFMKQGYQHVSVDGLARSSGVSKETIYRHFDDKQALFRAAMQGVTDEFAHDFADIFRDDDTPETILARCARAIYDRAADTDHPSPNWLAVGTAASFPELARAVGFDAVQSLIPLQAFLERLARERGGTGAVPLDIVAQFGALSAGGMRHLMGGAALDEADRELAARRVAELFLHGCAADVQGIAETRGPLREFTLEPAAPARPVENHVAHLMSVARAHFYEQGYRGAGLDEIGAIARVGRGTLYRHFGSKKGLFKAVMMEAAGEIMAKIHLILSTAQPVADNLHCAAVTVSAAMQGDAGVRLYRTVSAEAKAMPEVAHAIHDMTRERLVQPIADYLRYCSAEGLLTLDDPTWAADQFVILATGGNRYLLDPSPTEADRVDHAHLATATFLHGYLGK